MYSNVTVLHVMAMPREPTVAPFHTLPSSLIKPHLAATDQQLTHTV